MSETIMALVEQLRVAAIQTLEAARELDARGVKHEVVVRRHQAERVDRPVEAFDAGAHMRQEHSPVGIVSDDGASVDPARDHMEVAIRKCGSKHPWHVLS